MDHDWVGEYTVRFGGAEGALTMCLGLGPIGTLVSREAHVELGPLDGVVRGFFDLDPEGLQTALQELLGRRTLSGDVCITGSEHGEFKASVTLHHGRGTLDMRLKTGFAQQDGGGTLVLTTDQSHLTTALRQLQRALRLSSASA